MESVLVFILGAAFGSFINVLAMRYHPDLFLFGGKVAGGRSHCPHCKRTLRWFELLPFFSFIFQGGRCRTCRAKLSLRYPLMELFTGVLFLAVTARVFRDPALIFPNADPERLLVLAGGYGLVFVGLLLMSLIDKKWQIIPDELTVLLGLLGIALTPFLSQSFQFTGASFTGGYAPLFGFREWGILVNRLFGSLAAGGFLLALYMVTRGRGIGFGDVKLSFALGLIFGWPDSLLIHLFAFVFGSVYGIFALLRGQNMKSLLPFGPFLALGALVVYLWGERLLDFYFSLFGLNPLQLI